MRPNSVISIGLWFAFATACGQEPEKAVDPDRSGAPPSPALPPPAHSQAELQRFNANDKADGTGDKGAEATGLPVVSDGIARYGAAEGCWFETAALMRALGAKLPPEEVERLTAVIENSGVNGIKFHYARYPNETRYEHAGRNTLVFAPTEPSPSGEPTASKSTGGDLEVGIPIGHVLSGRLQNHGSLFPPYDNEGD